MQRKVRSHIRRKYGPTLFNWLLALDAGIQVVAECKYLTTKRTSPSAAVVEVCLLHFYCFLNHNDRCDLDSRDTSKDLLGEISFQ
jgi:hypothetical protein